jgi:hypothetical protein
MKKFFYCCFLISGLMGVAACTGGNTDPEPDPCETNPQPGCPNYVDPCVANPQPGCPNYVDPCETNPQPGCPNYVDPCIANPQPGCSNYDVDPAWASTITIGATTYDVTTTINELEDGFWYLKAQVTNASKPLVIHAVRYNTHTTGYRIEAWSGKDSLNGKETPSALVTRYAAAGREVKVTINGGLYGMSAIGVPTDAEIVNGMMNCLGNNENPVVGFDDNNQPYIDDLTFNAKVKSKNGVEWAITNVNSSRWEDWLVLYNSAKGKRTGTNLYGTEVLCAPRTGYWEALANHLNVRCKVEQVEPMSNKGNMAIPKGKIVLSGNGTANTYLSGNLQVNDEVEVTVDYTLTNSPGINSTSIRNAVAGTNIVLKNNAVLQPPNESFYTGNEPRTAVGYSAQKDFVYFVVVDGRKPGTSVGVSTMELAQVMQYLGATDAINLDGGGSSCLMVGTTTKNVPSDGSQRAVCNGLAIIKN